LFNYNLETARNPRLSGLFCDAKAPEKASLWDLPPIYAQFSLMGDRAGALSSEHQASRKPSRVTNSSRKLTRLTSPHGIAATS
jgi:hypothetical protein